MVSTWMGDPFITLILRNKLLNESNSFRKTKNKFTDILFSYHEKGYMKVPFEHLKLLNRMRY